MSKKTLLFLFLMPLYTNGQYFVNNSAISNCGGTVTGTRFNIDFTLGEIFTATVSASEVSLSQGFHQPILVEPGNFDIQVYPNPFNDFLYLNMVQGKGFEFLIFDILGRTIFKQIFDSSFTKIDLLDYDPGRYFYQVRDFTGNTIQGTILKQ